MSYQRREFLKLSSGFASAIAFSSVTGKPGLTDSFFEGTKKLKAFGLQLYSLRDVLPNDPKGILKQVASFGYKQIESYEGPKGMFWGMSNTEFKKYMDDLGMTIISSHCDTTKDFEKKVADAAAIGPPLPMIWMCPCCGRRDYIDKRLKQKGRESQSQATGCKAFRR